MTDEAVRAKLNELGCSFKENRSFSDVGYWKIGGVLRWLVSIGTIINREF